MRWFTSDTHFGHANVLRYSKRPFASVEEMNEAMIARWNARVAPDDEVWHLGDFAFTKKPRAFFERLAGRKHFIVGNHDHKDTRKLPWASIQYYTELRDAPTSIVLCHYPLEVWNKSHFGSIHLHGHSHGSLPKKGKRIDVGVDPCLFDPVSEPWVRGVAEAFNVWAPDHHKPREEETK